MTKKSTISTVLFMLLVGVILLGSYKYMLSDNKIKSKENEKTQIQHMIDINLEEDYPKTPREVVKLYSKMMVHFYDLDAEESDVLLLAKQSRKLLDAKLLENNPTKEYLSAFKKELEEYKNNKLYIKKFQVESHDEVVYFEEKGEKYAKVKAVYYMSENYHEVRTNQEYLLRQDKNDKWHIMGWSLVDDK